jgi:hypothetical protein
MAKPAPAPAGRMKVAGVEASMVTPLSAVRTAQLAPSLQLPRIRSSAVLRAVQMQLLQDLMNESYLQPYVTAALQAAGRPIQCTHEDGAATRIQARVRSMLISRWVERSHRMARRLQRWVRGWSESREPQGVVDVRRKLAFIPAIMSVCGAATFIARFFSSGIYAMPPTEFGMVSLGIVSLQLSAAIRLRQPVFGRPVSLYMGAPLFALIGTLFLVYRGWRIHHTPALAHLSLASRFGFKSANHGISLGILPSPPGLWVWSIGAVALSAWLLVLHSADALDQPATPSTVLHSLHVPALVTAGACSSRYLSSTALRRAEQFEEVLGDLRQLLAARSTGGIRRLDACVERAWREGPLARIHLMAAQVAVGVGAILLACEDGQLCAQGQPAGPASSLGSRWAATVGLLALSVSAALYVWPLCWSKLVALGVVLLPGHTPLDAAVRGLTCRVWASLAGSLAAQLSAPSRSLADFLPADQPTCLASIHPVTASALGEAGGHSLLEPARETASSMLLDTTPALLSGFVVATCPLPAWVRANTGATFALRGSSRLLSLHVCC